MVGYNSHGQVCSNSVGISGWFIFTLSFFLTYLLYTFLFSRIVCTHFCYFSRLSRADILNRIEEKIDVLLVENQPRVFVIALDLVFRQ